MGGIVKIEDQRWSVSSGLFYWVVDTLADLVADPATERYLREVSDANLGWVQPDDLDTDGRSALADAMGRLPEVARDQLPASPHRDEVLVLVDELAILASTIR